MDFQQFKKLCQGEPDLYYYLKTAGLAIQGKVKDVDCPYVDIIYFNFNFGTVYLNQHECIIKAVPQPPETEKDCYFCYKLEYSSSTNCEHLGYIYKPKNPIPFSG